MLLRVFRIIRTNMVILTHIAKVIRTYRVKRQLTKVPKLDFLGLVISTTARSVSS